MQKYDRKYFEDNFDNPNIPNIPDSIKVKSIRKKILKISDINSDTFLSQIRVNDDIAARARRLNESFNGIFEVSVYDPITMEKLSQITLETDILV